MSKVLNISIAVVLLAGTSAMAVPIGVFSEDTPPQDSLILHYEVDELGIFFPPDELIDAMDFETDYTPCEENFDDPAIPNAEVWIVNLTDTTWSELVYVADPETFLGNDDGLVNGELAFNIDDFGANRPLIYEDFPNLLFEPGEMWGFVIQDYANLFGLPASAFGSVGLVGGFSGGDFISSGSIIAIPEPVTLAVLILGGLATLIRRRR